MEVVNIGSSLPTGVVTDIKVVNEENGPVKIIRIKPHEQLILTEEALDAELQPFSLTAKNSQAEEIYARYSHGNRSFMSTTNTVPYLLQCSYPSTVIHIDSQAAISQEEYLSKKNLTENVEDESLGLDLVENPDAKPITSNFRDSFRFIDRSCETINREVGLKKVSTHPPLVSEFSGSISLSVIYDAYMQEIENQKGTHTSGDQQSDDITAIYDLPRYCKVNTDPMYQPSMKLTLEMIENIIVQNSEGESFMDYKYWEDVSDGYRNEEGTLLPLWKITVPDIGVLQVTTVAWMDLYPHIFAVGFGSTEYLYRAAKGYVMCYSLKNIKQPIWSYTTEAGVYKIAWSPEKKYLLAVALYDGSLVVFDLRLKRKTPVYTCDNRLNNSNEPLWHIEWEKSTWPNSPLRLMTVAGDGVISIWTLLRDTLVQTILMRLTIAQLSTSEISKGEAQTEIPCSAYCMEIHWKYPGLFLIGTGEGLVYLCSKIKAPLPITIFKAHTMPVYKVTWNLFYEDLFLTCSADWTVKLFHKDQSAPLLQFDMFEIVSCVAWSPYSSTVFAIAGFDGCISLFDISCNKYKPLCSQKLLKKGSLTDVAFSVHEPVLLVGDSTGCAHIVKLSPNLRLNSLPFGSKSGNNSKNNDAAINEQILKIKRLLRIL